MRYFVIAHKTKGWYVGEDWSTSGETFGPRFRWSILRSDPDVYRFWNRKNAEDRLKKFPAPLAAKSEIQEAK